MVTKRSQRASVVMPSELINVEHPFYNSPSVHLAMLKDDVRVIAFKAALQKLIKPDETTVLEVGTGTGILSLMAASLGAKSVFATEAANGMIEISQTSFSKNETGTNINLIPIDDTNPEPALPNDVDIIVSECLGHFAFDENMVRVVASLKPRLSAKGQFVPRRIRLVVATTNSHDISSTYIEPWNDEMYGFDFSHIKEKAIGQIYVKTFHAKDLNSNSAEVIDYIVGDSTDFLQGGAKLVVNPNETIYGLVGWFEAELAEDIWLSTSPMSELTHWEQVFMPFEDPISFQDSTELNVDLEISSSEEDNKVLFTWRITGSDGLHIEQKAIV